MNCYKQNHRIELNQFKIGKGDAIYQVRVDCCLWGDLNKPVVVLMGGISASRWALDTDVHGAGWWRGLVNENTVLNFTDYCYLTFEYFSFAERINNPPVITTADQAKLLAAIQTQLNLPRFHAVIGASYGGMVSLAFAAQYPDDLERLVCIAAADRNSVKTQAIRYIQRQIIRLGCECKNLDQEKKHLALARSLAVIGYRGDAEFEQRFQSDQQGRALSSLASYLDHQGDKFTERFSTSRYLQLSESIDQHQVDVSSIKVMTHLVAFASDQLVPLSFVKELENNLPNSDGLTVIDSLYGHDGFLLETQKLNQVFCDIFNSTDNEQNNDIIQRNNRCASRY